MSEANEQIALFRWAGYMTGRIPELDRLLHVPNGEKRDKSTAARLKLMGVKPGVPDVFLPIPRNGFHGLWIEMKFGRNKTTEYQDTWIAALQQQGYMVVVAYNWCEAARAIVTYLYGHIPSDINI